MAFAVAVGEVEAWQVGGNRSSEQVLRLTPTSSGTVSVEVATSEGDDAVTLLVRPADSAVQIVGPGHLVLDEVTSLSVDGAGGQAVTWTVGGDTFRQPTLEVRPNELGTLTVELETEDGTRVSRTFTIA